MNNTSARKPIMAALMSLILPGFGQLYNGQLNKGVLLFIGFTLLSTPLPALAALYLPSVIMLPIVLISLLMILAIWLYSIANAWNSASLALDYTPKLWQQPATYIAAFISGLLVLMITGQYIRGHLIESFHIPSASMEPSILTGDLLFADKRYNCPNCKHHAQRGDIAIFVYPNNRSRYYIKRIIGLPGDRIKIQDQTIYINGQTLTQKQTTTHTHVTVTEQVDNKAYQVKWTKDDQTQMSEMIVPAGSVFVLGDNRSATKDSREFGVVPLMDVLGKTRQIWFSWGKDGIRWGRIGQVVQE